MTAEELLKLVWEGSSRMEFGSSPVTIDDLVRLGHDRPVHLLDGHYGLPIIFGPGSDQVGVQVPGEEAIRWLSLAAVQKNRYDALIEVPTFRCAICGSQAARLTQPLEDHGSDLGLLPSGPIRCETCEEKLSSGRYVLAQTMAGDAHLVQVRS